MQGRAVALVEIDETVLAALLETARTDAAPGDVMAPVAGPPGWTTARREAFLAYHRSRQPTGAGFPAVEVTYAVSVAGDVAGALRLAVVDADPTALEVGLWLGRRFRGRGVGRAVLTPAAVRARALGATRLVASTTAANLPALAVLRGAGYEIADGPDGSAQASLVLG